MDRTILHCDCNSFYASVECLLRPELDQGPMAVCGDPESRHGIILAKNEKAKRYGIQTAETIWQAQKKCPHLTLVAPHRQAYACYSRAVNEIYQRFTDLVEPFSIDESWLDVTHTQHLFGDGPTIADTLRRTVREELGLTISVGVSFNKVFAKLGSDYKKPDATTVIFRPDVPRIVYPLPVTDLLLVGRTMAQALSRWGVRTIGELAQLDPKLLRERLGKAGETVWRYANGLDESPVRSAYEAPEVKSVGHHVTFPQNLTTWPQMQQGIYALCDQVAARLRKHKLECQSVHLTIKDPEFHVITRQRTLPRPTQLSRDLAQVCTELLRTHWLDTKPIRMLAVTAGSLCPEGGNVQISLFDNGQAQYDRLNQLEHTVDQLREKFGRDVISLAPNLPQDREP